MTATLLGHAVTYLRRPDGRAYELPPDTEADPNSPLDWTGPGHRWVCTCGESGVRWWGIPSSARIEAEAHQTQSRYWPAIEERA